MIDRITCDASTLVAMLVDGGPSGQWATSTLANADLLAPHLALFEAANIFRRHQLAELITPDQAAQAHVDLLDLPIDLWPYSLLAPRAWQLRNNLSVYDGSYVALAEMTGTGLATLDARIARAPGIACDVVLPPSG
ncbi:MAG: type II toxin-antitoxin system VapC family toxin [Acidimicrobiales bacterium]